jgi:hypothetical protein
VFFAVDGGEMKEVRIQGEVNADTLAAHLGAVLASIGTQDGRNINEIAAISR